MGIAIITGASSGLGREYARIAAGSGRYEELWLIARREDRLEALKEEIEAASSCAGGASS